VGALNPQILACSSFSRGDVPLRSLCQKSRAITLSVIGVMIGYFAQNGTLLLRFKHWGRAINMAQSSLNADVFFDSS
jgi:hypothetical protein